MPDNLTHVLRMVLGENKGQVLTEAMILGLEASITFYMNRITQSETAAVQSNGKTS